MQCNHQIIPKEGKPDVGERVKLKKGGEKSHLKLDFKSLFKLN